MRQESELRLSIDKLIGEIEVIILSLQNSSIIDNQLLREHYFNRIAEIDIEIRKIRVKRIAAELDGSFHFIRFSLN